MSAPVLDVVPLPDGIRRVAVVRDDLLRGGTKVRVLVDMMREDPAEEFVFGGPAQGYAQLALAYAAREVGKRATYFVALRRGLHPYTAEAEAAGAFIVQVPAGRLAVVQHRAKRYAADRGARFYPLGFDVPEFHSGLDRVLAGVKYDASEVWATAGSGALTRALQRRWPDARHYAVRIGFPPDVGGATLLTAPEAFGDPAACPPPFPSCPWYDAKVWRFVVERATDGALVWNVGA
jgi:hypothetical protein